ncbi:hypothetical protein C8J57DRAFT_1581145 [Mycena rebaudengoi]|nr:hypothetical protein C8J57DRAFT_1581145 [Mycena rebaudengoi]
MSAMMGTEKGAVATQGGVVAGTDKEKNSGNEPAIRTHNPMVEAGVVAGMTEQFGNKEDGSERTLENLIKIGLAAGLMAGRKRAEENKRKRALQWELVRRKKACRHCSGQQAHSALCWRGFMAWMGKDSSKAGTSTGTKHTSVVHRNGEERTKAQKERTLKGAKARRKCGAQSQKERKTLWRERVHKNAKGAQPLGRERAHLGGVAGASAIGGMARDELKQVLQRRRARSDAVVEAGAIGAVAEASAVGRCSGSERTRMLWRGASASGAVAAASAVRRCGGGERNRQWGRWRVHSDAVVVASAIGTGAWGECNLVLWRGRVHLALWRWRAHSDAVAVASAIGSGAWGERNRALWWGRKVQAAKLVTKASSRTTGAVLEGAVVNRTEDAHTGAVGGTIACGRLALLHVLRTGAEIAGLTRRRTAMLKEQISKERYMRRKGRTNNKGVRNKSSNKGNVARNGRERYGGLAHGVRCKALRKRTELVSMGVRGARCEDIYSAIAPLVHGAFMHETWSKAAVCIWVQRDGGKKESVDRRVQYVAVKRAETSVDGCTRLVKKRAQDAGSEGVGGGGPKARGIARKGDSQLKAHGTPRALNAPNNGRGEGAARERKRRKPRGMDRMRVEDVEKMSRAGPKARETLGRAIGPRSVPPLSSPKTEAAEGCIRKENLCAKEERKEAEET